MAIPSFIDVAVTTTAIKVENRATRGSNSFLSGGASISVGISPDVIVDPPAGSVVLGQASRIVQRSDFERGVGKLFRGGSASISVTDVYYDDFNVSVFVNTQRPAVTEILSNVVIDTDKRVYWS